MTTDYLHEGYRSVGRVLSVRVFLRQPNPHLRKDKQFKFFKKKHEISNRLARWARMASNPEPLAYQL